MKSKKHVMDTYIMPILTYSSQTRAPKKEEIYKLRIYQRKMDRKLFNIAPEIG